MNPDGIQYLLYSLLDITKLLPPILVGLALLVFLWGMAKFIFRAGEGEKAVEEGKNIMKWGLIALFVMVSVWGIVKFFQAQLNLPSQILSP